MSEYGVNTLGTIVNGDIFGSYKNVRSIPGTILTGSGALTRGCLLGKVTASGKLVPWDSAVNPADGSETIYAALGVDVDATNSDIDCFVFVDGVFLKDKLTAAQGQSIAVGVFSNIVIVEEEY